jgi:glycosyltransferase involved in cell wall biosynthesis
VLRAYHAGGREAHQARERALAAAGLDVILVIPSGWNEPDHQRALSHDEFGIVELPVRRSGDINRHAYADPVALSRLVRDLLPTVLDVHEEPFSIAARQWLAAAPCDLPIVMYTAQNVDKRYPPPFAQYERSAYQRAAALYPCSRQAAAVARGKGFAGLIDVIPLGFDETLFVPGTQSLDDDEILLGLFGRLVPEKGVADAVEILARTNATRPTRLVVVGQGPEGTAVRELASALGLADRLEVLSWQPTSRLAEIYRTLHFMLVPSRPTTTWVEQFGRVIVEAQASGAVVAGYASGAIPEVAGESAILQDVGAAAELGDRIATLTSDPREYNRRRTQGIELSRSRTWTEVAARQADLYRRVVAGDFHPSELPSSPRRRRALARAEFGPTASTTAGARPFALPVLRRGGRVPGFFAWLIDAARELVSRTGSPTRGSQVDKTSR